jgi:hypothetical protein
MKRTSLFCRALLLAIACAMPLPLAAQILPAFGKAKGLPKIPIIRDGLPALANPAYGEVMLSGNDALLEPAWLVGSLRDGATGQVLKWNNYLLPDAKPNVKLLTDTVFEGFVDSSAAAKAEWLSTVKLQAEERAVAEVVVTRVSVTSVGPKQIDRTRLFQEIVQRLPPDQQNRYSVIIAYIDIAITATRFQHYDVEGDVTGYGGRIGGDWYYKDKQKSTDHRLVAISAPLQFALTAFAAPSAAGPAAKEKPCYELVSDAIKQGRLPAEKNELLAVLSCTDETSPIAIAGATLAPGSRIGTTRKTEGDVVGKPWTSGEHPIEYTAPGTTARFPRPWEPGGNANSASSLPAYSPPTPPVVVPRQP